VRAGATTAKGHAGRKKARRKGDDLLAVYGKKLYQTSEKGRDGPSGHTKKYGKVLAKNARGKVAIPHGASARSSRTEIKRVRGSRICYEARSVGAD